MVIIILWRGSRLRSLGTPGRLRSLLHHFKVLFSILYFEVLFFNHLVIMLLELSSVVHRLIQLQLLHLLPVVTPVHANAAN